MTTEKKSKTSPESIVRQIKRKTRRKFSAEEKIRIVLTGLRGEESITDLCRKEGIHPTKRNIIIKKESSIDELIRNGVGESLLLAEKLGCPLYSDDTLIREWGTNKYNIRTFSTLSLLSRLMNEEYISLNQETSLYAEMINKNFRLVPFQPYHLTNRLKEIAIERKNQSLPPPKNKDLKNDSILRIFLKQFGESSISPLIRADLAIKWWISVLENKSWIRELAEECMEYISFCLSQITKSGVIEGIKKEENEHNVSLLWALFWWRCNLKNPDLNCFAWLAIKENCKRLFSTTEEKQEKILFRLIPMYVIEAIKKSDNLEQDEKLNCLYKLTKCFKSGEADKERLEEAFAKRIHKKGLPY